MVHFNTTGTWTWEVLWQVVWQTSSSYHVFPPFREPHNHLTRKKKAIKNVFYRLSLAYKTSLQGETFSQPSPCLWACQASLFSQEEFGVTRQVSKGAFSFTGTRERWEAHMTAFPEIAFPIQQREVVSCFKYLT